MLLKTLDVALLRTNPFCAFL